VTADSSWISSCCLLLAHVLGSGFWIRYEIAGADLDLAALFSVFPFFSPIKGRREKKSDESDVHLPQPPKQSSYLLHFILFYFCFYFFTCFFLIALFGVSYRGEFKKTKRFFLFKKKKHLDSSQKMLFFSLRFLFFFLGCFARFFYCVFGRFATRGVQKRD
jgi:hypothetical protein